MEITRRDTIKMLGATAFVPALALPAQTSPSADLIALRDKVQGIVDGISQEEINQRLWGQYSSIFRSTYVGEAIKGKAFAVDHTQEPSMVAVAQPVRFVHTRLGNVSEQRWVYNLHPEGVELGYAVAPAHTDQDIRATALALVSCFREQREINAAAILNKAQTYDASVAGNGKPLISVDHPHDNGVWANTFGTLNTGPIGLDLNLISLTEALERIQTAIVDDGGIKILVHGRKLIVPVALMDVAEHITPLVDGDKFPYFDGFMVCDYLEHNHHWFVLTSVPGLIRAEAEPFRMKVDIDGEGRVVVIGTEKCCFGYHDQRAIFGSLPTA